MSTRRPSLQAHQRAPLCVATLECQGCRLVLHSAETKARVGVYRRWVAHLLWAEQQLKSPERSRGGVPGEAAKELSVLELSALGHPCASHVKYFSPGDLRFPDLNHPSPSHPPLARGFWARGGFRMTAAIQRPKLPRIHALRTTCCQGHRRRIPSVPHIAPIGAKPSGYGRGWD